MRRRRSLYARPVIIRGQHCTGGALSDGRPRRVTTLLRGSQGWPSPDQERRGIYDSSLDICCRCVSALSPRPRGSVRSDHRRVLAAYSSVGALRSDLLPSGQLTGVIVVLADDEVERALVVVAHPDDVDFWAGGTVACWTSAGTTVTYCVLSDGDSGGFDPQVPRSAIPGIRRTEQEAAAAVLGVSDVRFLGYPDGCIEPSYALRRDITGLIRQVQPARLLTWSPEWSWRRFHRNHPDHRAAGEAALSAVFPDARNPFAHPELLNLEGLEPWEVGEVWLIGGPSPNHYVDITDVFDRKLTALQAHESQTAHRDRLEEEMRERLAPNSQAAGLPADRLVEAFQVVTIA
jgi:LmbE family N-acetylglucosaminyl deacetylase